MKSIHTFVRIMDTISIDWGRTTYFASTIVVLGSFEDKQSIKMFIKDTSLLAQTLLIDK